MQFTLKYSSLLTIHFKICFTQNIYLFFYIFSSLSFSWQHWCVSVANAFCALNFNCVQARHLTFVAKQNYSNRSPPKKTKTYQKRGYKKTKRSQPLA